jgi:2-methylaconitate cis-trans-isomerase PrpF
MAQLECYAKRVRENRDVMPALDFARYIINSRMDRALSLFATDGHLKIDPLALVAEAHKLKDACQERFSSRDVNMKMEAVELQSLHEKIDTVGGQVTRLVAALTAAGALPGGLQLISGGLDAGPEVQKAAG